jgi:dTDP-4-dehydrorhamnose reductase
MKADALILGARGMLGHVAARVMSAHAQVLTAGRADANIIFDARRDDGDFGELLADLRPGGLVVNAIAILAGDIVTRHSMTYLDVLSVNAIFPHRLAEAARARNQRVIQISTDAVFGPAAGTVTEADPISPCDLYGVSKAGGELHDDHCLTIRCSLVGPPAPGRNKGLWGWLIQQKPGNAVPGYVNQLWSGCTTRQVAEICQCLLDDAAFSAIRAKGAVHHYAPNRSISKYDLLRMIAQQVRPDLRIEAAQSPTMMCRLLDSKHRSLDALMPHQADWTAAIAAAASQH